MDEALRGTLEVLSAEASLRITLGCSPGAVNPNRSQDQNYDNRHSQPQRQPQEKLNVIPPGSFPNHNYIIPQISKI